VPRIHFGVGTGELLGLMSEAGADVVGVDWRVPLDEAARRTGPGKGRAGQNLDPAILLAPWAGDQRSAPGRSSAAAARQAGTSSTWATAVMPETDPDVLARLTDLGPRGVGDTARLVDGQPASPRAGEVAPHLHDQGKIGSPGLRSSP